MASENILVVAWEVALYNPFLNLILVLYEVLFDNLGFAIIFVTLLIKMLTYPLSKYNLENTEKMKQIQPELQKLQKKYKKDPLTMSKKQQELYQRVGYKPLGCFTTMVIQIPIFIALYRAVRAFSESNIEGVYSFVSDWFHLSGDFSVNTWFYIVDLAKSGKDVYAEAGLFSPELIGYVLLMVLVFFVQYLSVRFSMGIRPKTEQEKRKANKKKKKSGKLSEEEMQAEMQKTMESVSKFSLPLVIAWTSFSFPSALSLYYLSSYVVQIIQQFLIGDKEFIFKKIQVRIDEFIHRKPKSVM